MAGLDFRGPDHGLKIVADDPDRQVGEDGMKEVIGPSAAPSAGEDVIDFPDVDLIHQDAAGCRYKRVFDGRATRFSLEVGEESVGIKNLCGFYDGGPLFALLKVPRSGTVLP